MRKGGGAQLSSPSPVRWRGAAARSKVLIPRPVTRAWIYILIFRRAFNYARGGFPYVREACAAAV